ncbi:uncharacterized protein LOC129747718 isoform X2 [Uranotaenia lowii]|uniref:uncharacterized protein LOC129747718 isoform X2 n=1 Tax=Uranotaenia lowii TaxID=190385 RepID=UPI00247AA82C|nr:uncharacterized protein LOC129747718 isoform X2 [Uranotaenia lowii]
MWNKLFKSKSKSSKNLSSDRGGGSTTSSALDLVPGSSGTNGQSSNPRNQTQTYYSNDGHFYDKELYEATGVVVLRGSEESEQHRKRRHEDQCRDSIVEGQMCGIPMRRSKFSSAFKSLSLKRGSNKNQLKLYHGIDISGTEALESGENGGGIDNVNFNANGSKRSSMLRPSKSDNNLSEKPKYPDPEKEDPDYIEQYKGGGNENDDQPRYRQDSRERQISPAPRDPFKEISPEPPSDLELRPCPICARKFVPPSLAKHISICERIQTKKRKPFDSSRQRREGTELASYLPKNFGLPQGHPAARVSPPKTTIPVRKFSKTPTPERKDYGRGSDNIMSTSLTLTSSMMATTSDGDSFSGVGAGSGSGGGGGGGGSGVGSGGSTTSTTRPTLKRSLSQQNEPCPYCERCFGFKAYDRHVEWCREKALLSKNANNTQSISAAKERLQARLQYKVPQIKSKRAFTRDKYSGSLSCGGSTSSLADLDLPLPRHRSHLNSMSSSLSSDNKSDPPSSTRKVTPTGNNQYEMMISMAAGNSKSLPRPAPTSLHEDHHQQQHQRKVVPARKREIRANLLENENYRNQELLDQQQQQQRRGYQQISSKRDHMTDSTQGGDRAEKLELVGRGEQRVPLKRGATKIVKCNKSGYTPDRYDPFLSAKRQLEELFSPSSTFNTSLQQTANSRATTPLTPTAAMTKSVMVTPNNKTSPTVINHSNFRRAFSLRMPRKVSRPLYVEKAKSNIQKGITDDGPVSPNFLKSSEYDEIPIKSAFNALQMAEKPKMRDSSATRKNLKLDIKDPNMPASDIPLSKTDSLAAFLKYEHELNLAAMSEKDMKDKSNSLSKRSSSLSGPERKDSLLYGGMKPNVVKKEPPPTPTPKDDKTETSVQDLQPFKKLQQKLMPIKLEPINITYNSSNSNGSTNNSNNNSNSNNNNNNHSNTNEHSRKSSVISLDAILGRSSKPKAPPPPEEKDSPKDPNYIDPKLINKCDNLPITGTKLLPTELMKSTKPLELSIESKERIQLVSNKDKPNAGVMPHVRDNRLKDLNSTKPTESYDKRPALIRQNGGSSASSSATNSRETSREESPATQLPQGPLVPARNQFRAVLDTKSQSPDSGLERTTPKPSTPIAVQKKPPERPPLPSFDDFDFDEFISSFQDERRSFKNDFYLRNPNSNNSNSNNNNNTNSSSNNKSSNSNSSFNQNNFTSSSFIDSSVKSVPSLNGSALGSPSTFSSPNNHSYYNKSFNHNARSEEPTKQQQQKQEPQQTTPQREAPQVPRRRMVGGEPASQPQVIGRTLPNIPQSSPAPAAESSPPFPQQTSKYAADPVNDSNNNNRRSSSPPAPPSRQGSNYSNRSYHQQPTPLSASTATKPNTTNYNNNIHTTSPYYNNSTPTTPVTPGGSINSHSNNGNSAPGIIFDDLSPTERDLMKSVQELDRMCESSSSMYPADSDEMSSVEGYPLSPGSIRREHHHHQRPSVSEGSKFSADSAYGSLSRQSPSEQQQQQQQSQQHSTTMRRSQHHYRSGGNSKTASNNTTSHQLHHHFAVLNQQQDAFDNSSGSESSLPPISAIKAQKIELHPAPIGSTAYKECPAAALLNSHMSKFCHECGSRFTISSAKFCMECGVRRIMLE